MLADVLRKVSSVVAREAGAVRAVADGIRWTLSPEGEALFGPSGPPLHKWLADGSAEAVKSGPHRTVYRARVGCETVYVKHCRVNGLRAWAREFLRPPKARLEFENAARLLDRGIGAAVPLAWGTPDSRWPGASYLITRDLAPAVPFPDLVKGRAISAGARRELALALGAFLARLHENGIAHPDPHPGNVMVEKGRPTAPSLQGGGENPRSLTLAGEEEAPPSLAGRSPAPCSPLPFREGAGGDFSPRFALLDVHAIRFGPPLGWADSRANLTLFNRWFQTRATRADRLRFWRAYRAGRSSLPDLGAKEAQEIEHATAHSNRRFWVARTARYAGTHRTVRAVRAGSIRGLAVRDLPDEFLRALLADPDGAFTRPNTHLLKDCPTSTVAEIELPTPEGPRRLIFKRVNVRHWSEPFKNAARASAAWRSWLMGYGLLERWLPTARPLAVFHRHRAGVLPAEGYLLTEKVPDAVVLTEAVQTCREPRVLRAWAEKLAGVTHTMHERGVSHRDLKAPNVLLEGAASDPATATPVLIDLVGVRARGRGVPFAQRAKELARLNASFLAMPHVTRTERLRFLRRYLGAEASQAGWKTWWRAVWRETARKAAKNRRRGRPLA
ncbi:MAG: hypothetical protein K2V38_13810 [Gemmataceae bacterium]|nr:hypothetical protein [Gemmataceae bacterium]